MNSNDVKVQIIWGISVLAGKERPTERSVNAHGFLLIIGENGLLKQLTKAILERALQAEITDHLGYEKHEPVGHRRGNTRNGKSQKTLKGEFGELELETPRDRKATFDPKIVAKGQTRWTGFDAKIISMYARGMTTRPGIHPPQRCGRTVR